MIQIIKCHDGKCVEVIKEESGEIIARRYDGKPMLDGEDYM